MKIFIFLSAPLDPFSRSCRRETTSAIGWRPFAFGKLSACLRPGQLAPYTTQSHGGQYKYDSGEN